MDEQKNEIELIDFLNILWKRKWLNVLIAGILGLLIFAMLAFFLVIVNLIFPYVEKRQRLPHPLDSQ